MIFRIFALLTIVFLAACGGGGGGSGNSGGNNNSSSNNVVSSTNNTSSVASSTNVISSTASSSANNSSSIANTSASSILGSTGNTSSNSSAAQANHQIALIAAPVSGGTVNGAGEYAAGSDVEVTAIPAENFLFVNWKESGVVVSTSATYTFKAEANRSLVANFVMEGPGQEEGWSHSFDATGESGGTSAREVTMDAAGNIYVAGVTSADLDGTYGESEPHYYVAKYTALGVPLYLKQFPALAPTTVTNTTVSNIEGLATDGDGNLYLLRMAVNSGPAEQQIPIVHKFSPEGEELEHFSLAVCPTADLFNDGSTTVVFAVDLAIDAQGNLFVAGDCWLKDGNGRHYFLAKYDSLGQRLFFNHYTSDLENVQAVSLTLDTDGNVYVAGITYGGLDNNTYIGGYLSAGDGTGGTYFRDGFVAKFDNQGTKLYTRQFGSGGSQMNPTDVAVDEAGNISVVGGIVGSIADQVRSGSYQDFLLVHYDDQGELQYARQFGIPNGGGSAMTVARAVDTDPEGNIYIVGDTSDGVMNTPSVGEYDSFLVKYKPEGDVEGIKVVGIPGGVMFGGDLEVDAAGNVFTAFESVDSDSQNSVVVKKEVGPWTLSTNPDPGGEEPDPVLDWKDNWLFVQSDKAVQYRLAKVREDSANSHFIFRIQYRVNSSDPIYTPASNGYHLYRLTDSEAEYRVEFDASFTGLNTIYELPDEIALFVDGIHVSWDSVNNELVYHDPAYRPSGYTSCVDDNSSTSRCEETYGWVNDAEVINYIAE